MRNKNRFYASVLPQICNHHTN
uniref:Uncharacterized protein n=1 Tax=Rhizophora mucronata TaxID=61149 RepID=A0A2P2ITK8_RHIMU